MREQLLELAYEKQDEVFANKRREQFNANFDVIQFRLACGV